MRIELLGHYSNINHSISQGEYEVNDERLHGLGKYLVDTGHARVIEEALPVVEVSINEPEIKALEEITFEPLAESDDFEVDEPVIEDESEDEPAPRKRNRK